MLNFAPLSTLPISTLPGPPGPPPVPPSPPSNARYARATLEGYNIPKRIHPFARDGFLTEAWWKYINSFEQAPPAEQGVTVAASPIVFRTGRNGTLLIHDYAVGSIVSIILASRNSAATRSIPPTQSFVPMSIGDQVTVAFNSAPILTFFPR